MCHTAGISVRQIILLTDTSILEWSECAVALTRDSLYSAVISCGGSRRSYAVVCITCVGDGLPHLVVFLNLGSKG